MLFSDAMIKHNVSITIAWSQYDMLTYVGLDHEKGTVFESVSNPLNPNHNPDRPLTLNRKSFQTSTTPVIGLCDHDSPPRASVARTAATSTPIF